MLQRFSAARALLSVAMLCLMAVSASAGTISYGSRYSTYSVTTAAGAVSMWNTLSASSPGTGYCDASPSNLQYLANGSMCAGGSGSDYFSHTSVAFSVASDTSIELQIGADYGRGATLLLDGNQIGLNSGNMYGDLFGVLALNLTAGNHTFELYGNEDCCGGNYGGFLVSFDNGQSFSALSTTSFADPVNDPVGQVPEPASLALLGSGLVAVGRRLRKW